MELRSKVGLLITTLAVISMATLAHGAELRGDANMSVGYVAPSGNYETYAKPGASFSARLDFRMPLVPSLCGWADFNYIWFDRREFDVRIRDAHYEDWGTESIENKAASFHLGGMIGNHSKRAFLRPRAGLGIGLYSFFTTYSVKGTVWSSGVEEEIDGGVDEMTIRPGFRILLGNDFFFVTRWGVSIDVVFDYIWNARQPSGLDIRKQMARYNGFSVGVTFPFSSLDDE